MSWRPALVLLLLVTAGTAAVPAQTMRTMVTSRPVAGEQSLRATIDFGAGVIRVASGPAGELYRMQLRYDADRNRPVQQFDPQTATLRLGLEGNGTAGIRVTSRDQLSQRGDFTFSPAVPLVLAANFGASDATLDLGGMTLRSLAVRGGASRTVVNFATPTVGQCSSATFALGASELEVRGLANSGCAEIAVDGGVGRVTLSFDGAWRRDQQARLSLAMGGLTLRIPRGSGVQLVTSRFLASLEAEGFTRVGDTWTTPGFERARHKLTVTVNASVADMTVEWLP